MKVEEYLARVEYVTKPYRGLPAARRLLIIRAEGIMIIPNKSVTKGDYLLSEIRREDIEDGFRTNAWNLIATKLRIARKDGLI